MEELLKGSITSLEQQISELQCDLLEKNTECNEDKMVITKLQEEIIQMQKEQLKQHKSEYKQNEADHETFKIQIEAEKQKAAEAQEALAQASAEVEEKAKEILALEESQYELQSMVQNLKKAKSSYDSKITEHTKEILEYKNLYDAEKQNTAKTQEALTQVSAELQEKSQETLALKKEQHEMQSTIQKLENALRYSKSEHDSKINECTKDIEKYRKLYGNEKDNTIKAQETLTQVSDNLQEKAKETSSLRENQDKLELMVQRLKEASEQSKIDYDSKLTEYTEEILKYKNLYDTEKQNKVKTQEHLTQISAELQGRTQEALALQKEQRKLKSTIEKLENTLRDFKSEQDSELTKELQKYKKLYEVQCDTLSQISAELHEKSQETLISKKKQQSTIQELENSLRDLKHEHDSKITEYSKEIKEYKNLNDNKNEDIIKAQEAMMQVSTELQEKEKEYLALKQSHNKLLCEKQNLEKQLQDLSNQYELYIKEQEDLQVDKENATKKLLEVFSENTDLKELQLVLKNQNTSLLQEKEDLECAIKCLQDENDTLKVTNEELKEPPVSPLSPIKYKTHVRLCVCARVHVCVCVCACTHVCRLCQHIGKYQLRIMLFLHALAS